MAHEHGLSRGPAAPPFFAAPSSEVPSERLRGAGRGARLWLLRHAEVHEDWQGVAYGSLDVPLSGQGLATTERAGRAFGALAPAQLLGSDLQRARALAEAVAIASGVPAIFDARLREIDRGHWQGRRVVDLREEVPDEIEAFYADPWRWRGHGGENDEAVFARVREPLEEAVAEAAGGIAIVCTHYNVIRVAVGRALGIAPDRTFGLRLDPGRGVLLEDAAAGWVLHRSNVVAPGEDGDPTDPTHPRHSAHSSGAPIGGESAGS